MPRIDLYLRSLERFGASAVVLESDQRVALRFPSGDRHATQTTPHEQLVTMIREIASDDEWSSLGAGMMAAISYAGESGTYEVTVTPKGSAWQVTMAPGAAAPPPARAEPPPPDVPAADDGMLIERTSYEMPEPDAEEGGRSRYIDGLLDEIMRAGASDLHLCSGCPPIVRLHGDMKPMEGVETLSADKLTDELMAIAPSDNREEFERKSDTDFAYAVPKLARFRVNVFRDRKGPGAVMRAIPFEIPDPEKIGLPRAAIDLCNLTKGLVLVTGPTGSGKSTTLAAMIDHINRTRGAHIITIEDPIEFVHPNKRCLINQREVGTHTDSFKNALRAALREDPDIVLVGEMRDLETIAIAVETAETGHLVFGTLHTTTAPSTVDRIIDQFPPDQQEQVRTMLAESLEGVVSQVLCRRVGGGRVAAHEILLGTNAVANLIRERKTFQLFSIMQTGRNQGMQTMNDALIGLVKSGKVEPNEAYLKAVNKSEMRTLLERAGHHV